MAADFNKPVTTDSYVDLLAMLRDNQDVLARMFASGTLATNIPVGAVRFEAGKFQTWDGSVWVDVPVSLDGGGTGAQSAAAARVSLGTHDAANLTTGVMSADRVPGLDASKIVSGTLTRDTSGSAASLTTARTINGTSFNGTASITTETWGTSRSISIGGSSKPVNGSSNVTWSRSEMGMLGEGQSWVGVSRSLDTTYTNNTGRCIEVRLSVTISGPSATSAAVFLRVNGVAVDEIQKGGNTSLAGVVSAIVPPGHTYVFERSIGGAGVLFVNANFTELR